MNLKKSSLHPDAIKALLYGVLGGGTLASGVNLVKHIQDTNRRRKEEQERKRLFIDVPLKKEASGRKTTSDYAAELILGAGGAGLSYLTLRKMFQAQKQKAVARELDQLQRYYYGALANPELLDIGIPKSDEGEKKASFGGKLGGGLLALLFATGLGSAYLTPKVLNKHFPGVKPPVDERPKTRRVRFVEDVDKKEQDDSKDVSEKIASVSDSFNEVQCEDIEGMIRLVLGDEKRASVSGLKDIVYAVADGRAKELLDSLDVDPDLIFSITKNAGKKEIDKAKIAKSIMFCSVNPKMAEFIAPIAAAEIFDMSPLFVKVATSGALSEEDVDFLVTTSRLHTLACRANDLGEEIESLKKSASSNTEIPEHLRRSIISDWLVDSLS